MTFSRVVITGASTGIGAALAESYAGPGVTLGLVARRAELLTACAARCEARGARVWSYAQDVVETAAMTSVAHDFVERAGGVDLVIANAGIGIAHRLLEGEAEDVAHLMRVNVIGVTNTIIPFLPTLCAARSGVLVAVGSFAGHRAIPGRSAYSASKAAVQVFMDGLRMDLVDSGVHAMTICPGFVRTPLTENNPDMMFVLEVEQAVAAMRGAIEARRNHFTFPWPMNLLKEVVKRAPESWLRKLAPRPRRSDADDTR